MGSRTPGSPLHAVQLRRGARRGPRLLPLLPLLLLLLLPPPPRVGGFNLDAEAPAVLSGPPGSFFGFSVEFYRPGTDGWESPGTLVLGGTGAGGWLSQGRVLGCVGRGVCARVKRGGRFPSSSSSWEEEKRRRGAHRLGETSQAT
ncbi:hypothetical protein FD755_010365 [Muntiacus reevesi]|uniref:Integrin alpha-2 domain-containing protein n=1 Tax=Muntiacus reevesi TaxID=9886 RepID=A0A5N3XZL5_MUNRE|nr:hypothetical protein FD755_010365 [Muntiacus reevesi]